MSAAPPNEERLMEIIRRGEGPNAGSHHSRQAAEPPPEVSLTAQGRALLAGADKNAENKDR